MTNVLLTVHGTLGDITPMARIGTAVKTRGHRATLITHCHYEDFAKRLGLEFVALDSPEEFGQYIEDLPTMYAPNKEAGFYRKHTLPLALREHELIEERCCVSDTVLIGSHLFFLGPQMAAETLGVPLARVFTSVADMIGVTLYEALCREVYAEDINHLRSRVGLLPVTDWHAWLRFPQCSMGAWPDWFASPEPGWPVGLGLVPVGFLIFDESESDVIPTDVQEFLESDDPPVLITGGTGMYRSDFYSVCVEACRLSGQRALVVTTQRQMVPRDLPDRVKWCEFVSFAALMPHLAAVVHHGGIGTLTLALRAGIPQLALAAGTDRPDTSIRFQHLGVAEYLPLPRWQPELIAESLGRLTGSPVVRERCQEMSRRMRAADPTAAVCEVVEGLISNNGPWQSTVPAAEREHGAPVASREKQDLWGNEALGHVGALSPEKRALLALRLKK
jgi:rhamnosyltransferase subunit B